MVKFGVRSERAKETYQRCTYMTRLSMWKAKTNSLSWELFYDDDNAQLNKIEIMAIHSKAPCTDLFIIDMLTWSAETFEALKQWEGIL